MLDEKIKRQFEKLREMVVIGLDLLGDGATYTDLVESGFVDGKQTPEGVVRRVIASISGCEEGEQGVSVSFDEQRFGTDNF